MCVLGYVWRGYINASPLISRAYPLTWSRNAPGVSPIGCQPSSNISFASLRQAPAVRERCGTSSTSNTVCVLIRSMPSSHILPLSPSRRRCQGSVRSCAFFCAYFNFAIHDTLHTPGFCGASYAIRLVVPFPNCLIPCRETAGVCGRMAVAAIRWLPIASTHCRGTLLQPRPD
jgi:hypothetical protein